MAFAKILSFNLCPRLAGRKDALAIRFFPRLGTLATLLNFHYGVRVGEAEVFKGMYATRDQTRIREVGFPLLDIKRYLSARGFEADGYRATYAQLAKVNRPAIAVVTAGSYRHFVVVKGVRGGKVLICDTAQDLKT